MGALEPIVSLLSETAIRLSTVGRSTRYDPVGRVVSKLVSSIPEFRKSIEDRERKRNGLVLRGAWPTTGRHILDWEIDGWGERGGDVILKINVWGRNGRNEGISYRANVATIGKLLPKIMRWFHVVKMGMKEE